MATLERVVIIGGGLAAASAAESLRASGFTGEVVIVTEEHRLPYERPPLSKGYLSGTDASSTVYPHDAKWYREQNIEVRRATVAASLDTRAREVRLRESDVETTLAYDRLLLATGSSPRLFEGPGASLTGVHTLRSLPDATKLRTALQPGDQRVVIVGGGWIGLEAAAAARGYGNDVTVLVRGEVPLSRVIGPVIGQVFRELHEDNGVDVRTGVAVTALRGNDAHVDGVVLGTGEELDADLVLFGIGADPNIALAASAGLTVDNGIVTDEGLATSAAGVYAAGDVARSHRPWLGRSLRVEHWANALAGGEAAGRVLAGEHVVYDEVPYFFSDQYDLGMEYAGYSELARNAELVVRGDPSSREFIAFWVVDDALVAGMNVNVWDVSEPIQTLIRSRRPVSTDDLTNPEISLASLAGSAR